MTTQIHSGNVQTQTDSVQIQSIRHATMIITCNNKRILVDPMLSPKHAMPPIPLTHNKVRNPTVELPVSLNDLMHVDAVLATHLHFDHFDSVAEERLPKHLPIFCQPSDAAKLQKLGFKNVLPVETSRTWEDITITRTDGNHGKGLVTLLMGKSSGFVLGYGDNKKMYIGGDAIFDKTFAANLANHTPDTVVLYGGHARMRFGSHITMGTEDILNVCKSVPDANVVVIHMEAINHCPLTRTQLQATVQKENLTNQVTIPENGEVVHIN